MTYMVIGDIHGQLANLDRLLHGRDFAERTAIFVGDYINRGSQSRAVVDRLIQVREDRRDDMWFLRGNHEALLLRWLNGGPRDSFVRIGGLSTVRSYTQDRTPGVLDRFIETFPNKHQEFLAATKLYFETEDMLVSHAGFDPAIPDARDEETMAFGRRSARLTAGAARVAFGNHRKSVLFGHYVQSANMPLMDHPLYCLDTGCGTLIDGRLTAVLMPEHTVLQY